MSISANVLRVRISRTFKKLQKVRHGLPLVFQQQRFIRLGLIGPDWKQKETLNMGFRVSEKDREKTDNKSRSSS